jgi:hypothetical protein
MDDKELAEFKDNILKLIADKEHGADINWLVHQFKIKGLNRSYLEKVLEAIDDFEKDVLHLIRGERYYLQRTPLTLKFLDKGGFLNQYESDVEADLEAMAISNQEQTIRDLTQENLKLANQVSSMKLKTYFIPLIISGISAIMAIGSLLFAFSQSTNRVERSELKSIQNEIEVLQSDFKKDNQELKSRLYEAEMLIAVYEEDSIQ